MKNGWYWDTSDVTKNAADVAQEKRAVTGLWWVSSIMEVRQQLGWGIASKPKAQNPGWHFWDGNVFLDFKLQIIRLAKGHWSWTPTHYLPNSYLYSCTYEKTYLAVHFTKGCFLSNCWQKCFIGLVLKC